MERKSYTQVPGTVFRVAATGQPLRGKATRCGSPARRLA